MGECWFIDEIAPAPTPDDEIRLLASTDLSTTAVIGDDFKWAQDAISGFKPAVSGETQDQDSSVISLNHYTPKELRYSFSTDRPRAAIFSEIYYPKGWKAWIEPTGAYGSIRNGHYMPTDKAVELNLFRADWMLRGAVIPEGEGQIIMRFEPDSYQKGEDISRASSIMLLLLLIASISGIAISLRKGE